MNDVQVGSIYDSVDTSLFFFFFFFLNYLCVCVCYLSRIFTAKCSKLNYFLVKAFISFMLFLDVS